MGIIRRELEAVFLNHLTFKYLIAERVYKLFHTSLHGIGKFLCTLKGTSNANCKKDSEGYANENQNLVTFKVITADTMKECHLLRYRNQVLTSQETLLLRYRSQPG
jgi:hypothetical protein